jgi:hypothetical protein
MAVSSIQNGLNIKSPAIYRIRVQGNLDLKWSDSLGGLQITVKQKAGAAPESLLVGKLEDQAALSGVLNTLYDLNFPVLSVECLEILDK